MSAKLCRKCGDPLKPDEKSICDKCFSKISQNNKRIKGKVYYLPQVLPKSLVDYWLDLKRLYYKQKKQRYLWRVPHSRPSTKNFLAFYNDYPNSKPLVKGILKFVKRQELTEEELHEFSYEEVFMLRHKIDWKFFSSKFFNKYPSNLINYIQFIKWDKVNRMNLNEELLFYFSMYIDVSKVYPPIMTKRFVESFKTEIDWDEVSIYSQDDEFLDDYKEYLNWDKYVLTNVLSTDQIFKYEDYIDFTSLSVPNIDFDTIVYEKYHNKFDWSLLDVRTKNIPIDIIRVHIKEINWKSLVLREKVPDDIILDNIDNYLESDAFQNQTTLEKFIKTLNFIDEGNYYNKNKKPVFVKTWRGEDFIHRLFVELYDVELVSIQADGIVIEVNTLCYEDYFKKDSKLYLIKPNNNIYKVSDKIEDNEVVVQFDKEKIIYLQKENVITWEPNPPWYQSLSRIELDIKDLIVLLIPNLKEYSLNIRYIVNLAKLNLRTKDQIVAFDEMSGVVDKYYNWRDDEDYQYMLRFFN